MVLIACKYWNFVCLLSFIILISMINGAKIRSTDEDFTEMDSEYCNIEIKNNKTILPKPSGNTIKLSCNISPLKNKSLNNLNITWTVNNTKIVRKMGTAIYKKWAIEMEDGIPEDSGMYKCTICSPCKCVDHTTKVIIQDRVNHKPILLNKTNDETLTVNDSAKLYCEFLSNFFKSIDWKFQKCVNYNCDANATNIKDSDDEKILKLDNVTHDDEGWYICTAANSLGSTSGKIYVRVLDELASEKIASHNPILIAVITIPVCVLFLFGGLFIVVVFKKLKNDKLMKHRIETVHQWTKKVIIYKPSIDPENPENMVMPIIKIEKQRTTLLQNSNSDSVPFNEYEFPLDTQWEIPRNQLSLGATLGEGAFGRVVMATYNGCKKSIQDVVAVKMVKEGHTDADMASLVREMEVMKMIGTHINIINLIGCCSQDGPLYVIVEYAPHGNLKDFLKKHKSSTYSDNNEECISQEHLLSFAFQVARGMQYLASRRCIHRDLAARNVLVCDDYIMKIADFGLARDIQDTDYYRKNTTGRLPIKWMAPESLQDKFYDTQSDVWSYGVLLWEILTYGEQPYVNVPAEELYNYLMAGHRMEKPAACSLNIYMLMRQCWNFDTSARPTFTEIVENLEKILLATSNEEYLDLAVPILETPPSSDDESDADTVQNQSLL